MILVFPSHLAYNRHTDGGVEPMNQPDQTPASAPRPAKPYTTPTLTVFGGVDHLTKGQGTRFKDFDGRITQR